MKKISSFAYAIIAILIVAILIILGTLVSQKRSASREEKTVDLHETQTQKTEFYNTAPISDAYISGDMSGLSYFDKSIYDKASEVISEIIDINMTDYDKELAIHDYITTSTEYDKKALGVFEDMSENADNPYGVLVNHSATCAGYTTTFKMFMDMLKIPNKLISAKDSDNDDHAWNMVELEGEWYYVDVTWDDPTPDEKNRPALHKYFNVTEKFLKENKHVWDSSELPKAESTKYSYKNMTKMPQKEAEYEAKTMY